ncbi:cell division protein ZapE [Pseudomonas duriflava]|uniref:Cell division protein ZapE n=1 Tax=Pseudomonas duriflava TaxID=459528 RepID=A0A562QNK9_9PSED|nr:cell division protein ZapE [Pseudomonas duriflava]TWI58317.1 cell division protein ZapE [Pseudomonas duriflava]
MATPELLNIGERVRQHFAAELASRNYTADAAQQAASAHLADWLERFLSSRKSWLRRHSAGVYIWGDVGRGKSFVMDAFFAAVPIAEKRRVHFHAFLQELQRRMRDYAGQADPLALVAREIARDVRLMCFDEFHVHDIGDAMLLGRMLKVLVDEGVGLVMTSNYKPERLCPNPLYRERFKPVIALIEQRFDICALDGGIDYRQWTNENTVWGRYVWPESKGGQARVQALLDFSENAVTDTTLNVNHHPLKVSAYEGERIWFDFHDLCGQPHSTADYIWIIEQFPQLAISGLNTLAGETEAVRQRFLNLVDIAYDRGVYLILCSEVPMDELAGEKTIDFSRTLSRLRQLKPEAL